MSKVALAAASLTSACRVYRVTRSCHFFEAEYRVGACLVELISRALVSQAN